MFIKKMDFLKTDWLIQIGILLLLFNFTENIKAQERSNDLTDSLQWLQENVIPINSVDFMDDNFSDLERVQQILSDKRIVVLGEPSHGDGTVFEAKNRIIKFLHQEMNFEVLVFESGFYDLQNNINRQMKPEEVLFSAEDNIFRVWTKSKEAWPIFDYAAESYATANPLVLSGMDIQFSTPDSIFMEDFMAYLKHNELIDPESNEIFTETLWGLLKNPLYTPDSTVQNLFLAELDSLESQIISFHSALKSTDSQDGEFWLQILENIRSSALTPWNQDLGFRERQMADNLIWLAEKKYPDKKIIVWVASVYSFRNRNTINTMRDGFTYQGTSMGDVLFQKLGNQYYNLAFTAYEGEYGAFYWDNPNQKIDPPSINSFDYYLGTTNLPFAWVDFSSMNNSHLWFNKKQISRPLGYSEMKANWPQICDGIFFIRRMYPSTER